MTERDLISWIGIGFIIGSLIVGAIIKPIPIHIRSSCNDPTLISCPLDSYPHWWETPTETTIERTTEKTGECYEGKKE